MRTSVAAAVALGTVLSVASVAPATSADPSGATSSRAVVGRERASAALQRAQQVVTGRATAGRGDGTLALRDLRLALPRLTGSERRQALGLLARQTDHPDVNQQTYRVPAKVRCAGHICLHWVPTTRDAPPGAHWVTTMLRLMNRVWSYETGTLGYRAPPSDGKRGGDARYDVYLKELFGQGLYGLSVPERPSPSNGRAYSGYLVLDNDFARRQFGADPIETARVTAAHELFHAIQFGYDVAEDHWLMESTATWMEEQFADGSNDNRQYLSAGQLAHPNTPLDTFTASGFQQYGNWPFFEYLSEHVGRGIVRTIWDQAAQAPGGHQFSAHAVRNALRAHDGLTDVFARYAAGNLDPAHAYQEGAAFPASGLAADSTLSTAKPGTGATSYLVRHLASQSVRAVPGADLTDPTWGLRVQVDGPALTTHPAALVRVVPLTGATTSTFVTLSSQGVGRLTVPFSHAEVREVTVTLVNASVAYHHCFTDGPYSCGGLSSAPRPAFRVNLTALKP